MSTIKSSKVVIWGLLGITAVATSWVTAKSASAGAKETNNVTIWDSSKVAMGSLADVRASGSSVSYIAVDVQATGTDSWSYVHMTAKTGGSPSITRECYSYDKALVALAASANGDSYVEFGWTDDGHCNHIRVVHDSRLAPKVP